jgi:hypothetical protein
MSPKSRSHNVSVNAGQSVSGKITLGKNSVVTSTTNQITTFRDKSIPEAWLRWVQDTETIEIYANDRWIAIDPITIGQKHPLDIAEKIKPEREDLIEIKKQYEDIINNDPKLSDLRSKYDELQEKYNLFDKIDGAENA